MYSRTFVFICMSFMAGFCGADTGRDDDPTGATGDAAVEPLSADVDAALAAATTKVAVARTQAERDPGGLIGALVVLGDAQLLAKNPSLARIAFEEALALASRENNPASAHLIGPTRGMARTLAAQSQDAEAIPYFERAIAITRRTLGLFDDSQQKLLTEYADSLLNLRRFDDARNQMDYLQRLGVSRYGAKDIRMAGVLIRIGDWSCKVGIPQIGRDYYRAALGIVSNVEGDRSMQLVEPLRKIARSYLRELELSNRGWFKDRPRVSSADDAQDSRGVTPDSLAPYGEEALKRAISILESSTDRSAAVYAETLLQLGDWYEIRAQVDKALAAYAQAWAVLNDPQNAGKFSPALADALNAPMQLQYALPLSVVRNNQRYAKAYSQHSVEMAFAVKSDGSVADAAVKHSDADERFANDSIKELRVARYRPRFVAGGAVDTPAMIYRQGVRQKAEDVDTATEEKKTSVK